MFPLIHTRTVHFNLRRVSTSKEWGKQDGHAPKQKQGSVSKRSKAATSKSASGRAASGDVENSWVLWTQPQSSLLLPLLLLPLLQGPRALLGRRRPCVVPACGQVLRVGQEAVLQVVCHRRRSLIVIRI